MIEPLVVEPSRLEAAGKALRGLVFPVPPDPIVAPGTDPVSAAVNATLPVIESPVIDGLPAVKAGLTKTGASITAAAGIYTDTDQRLGDHLTEVQFLAAAKEPAAGTSGEKPEGAPGDAPADGKKPSPAKPSPQPAIPQLDQITGAAGTLGSAMQSMQGAMGSVQGMQGAAATPAQLADSSRPADPDRPVEEDKPDEQQQSGAPAEGAAPSAVTRPNAPLAAPAGGPPDAGRSEVTL